MVAGIAAVVALLLRLLPTQTFFPGVGLDASWAWAMSYAESHGMAIGRDVVFTYGPYADVTSRLYDPALRRMLIAAPALLSAAYAAGLLALERRAVLFIIAAVLPAMAENEAFDFTLAVPAMLACASLSAGAWRLRAALVLLAPALALLPFMKLSYLPVAVVAAATICGLLTVGGRRRLAAAFAGLFAVALPLLWLAAGQRLSILSDYLLRGSEIISGYAYAMATTGDAKHFIFGISIGTLILVFVAAGARRLERRARTVLLLGMAALIFIGLKAAFVRQDGGHEAGPEAAAVLLLLILAAWLPRPFAFASGLAGLLIMSGPFRTGEFSDFAPLWPGWQAELSGAPHLADAAGMKARFDEAVRVIPELPWHPAGTADIYETGQSSLFASGLPWAPRPVVQSYSAYTPALTQLDADHLRGPDSAENIFFRPEPIDGRLAALEDGASWPALLSLYEPTAFDAATDLLWLKRASGNAALATPDPDIAAGRRRLGESVAVPDAPAIWARVKLEPTLAGRVAAVLAKAPALHITLHLANGAMQTFRFIPGMAETGFLISPLVMTTSDFARLRPAGAKRSPSLMRVVSFSLEKPRRWSWFWKRKFGFRLAPIGFPAAQGAALLMDPAPHKVTMPPDANRPTCYIDLVDGIPVTDQPFAASTSLNVQGWGAFDVQNGVAADTVDMALVAPDGSGWSVPSLLTDSFGVGAYFHHPFLLHVAIRAGMDVSALPAGTYRAAMILHRGTGTVTCPTRLRVVVSQ